MLSKRIFDVIAAAAVVAKFVLFIYQWANSLYMEHGKKEMKWNDTKVRH